MFICYIAYTSETKNTISELEKSINYWRNLYSKEEKKTSSLKKKLNEMNENNTNGKMDIDNRTGKVYLSEDELVIRKSFYEELLKYKKFYDDSTSKATMFDLSDEIHLLLLKSNSETCLLSNDIIAMRRNYYNKLLQEKNKLYFKQRYSQFGSQDDDDTWKDKYEKLNKKYVAIHDEVIYLRRAYDKEHAKNIELQKKLINKYTKEDILSIGKWDKFEQFVANRFKKRGYKTTLTSATNDGGKDIIVEKNGVKTYIECKYWQAGNSIGREPIQKLAGAAMMDGVKNAIFITTSSYHSNAYEAARALNSNGFNIQLWDTDKLLKFINS